jgi:putative nucleotidyltransferase with HDIG domain
MLEKAEVPAGALPPHVAAFVEGAHRAQRAAAHAEARECFQAALRRLSSPEDALLAASLFRWIGDTHRDEGDSDAAWDAYTVCRVIAELNGDGLNLAHVLNSLGILETQWGNLAEAAELYEAAERLANEVGEATLVAMVAQNTGILANIRGDLIGALRHYRRSLAGFRNIGDVKRLAGVLSNLGMLHTDLGHWAEAESIFAESAVLCEQVDDLRSRVMIEVNRTELFIQMGEYARAAQFCDSALELARRVDHHLGLGEVHKHYGVIYRETDRLETAEEHLREALEIAERYENPLLVAEVQRELAHVYRRQDRNRETLQALNHAHRVFSGLQARMDLADVDRRLAELEAIFLDVVRRWGESIESKDHYTAGHCQRVADYSCMLAEAVGFDSQTLKWFRMGALLHDLGKTVVPADLLNKAGRLSGEEWEVMRRHPDAGIELLSAIDFPWDIRAMVRSHHERWDGQGYPDGLGGDQIPLSARILCVADVFDALTTTRSYRGAHAPRKALEIMERDAGMIFDPELFALFRKLVMERIATG